MKHLVSVSTPVFQSLGLELYRFDLVKLPQLNLFALYVVSFRKQKVRKIAQCIKFDKTELQKCQ